MRLQDIGTGTVMFLARLRLLRAGGYAQTIPIYSSPAYGPLPYTGNAIFLVPRWSWTYSRIPTFAFY